MSELSIQSIPNDIIFHVLSTFAKEAYLLLPSNKTWFDRIIEIETREKVCEIAARIGHLELLKYAHQQELCLLGLCVYQTAAEHGHLDCLKYALQAYLNHQNLVDESEESEESETPKVKKTKSQTIDSWACAMAALNGHLGCLKYLHENGGPWHDLECENTARNGHLDCLIYLHVHGCPWNAWTCILALRYGHFDCLNYAISNGCPTAIYGSKNQRLVGI